MFYGRRFMFDGIPSEQYGLQIVNFDSSGVEDGSAGIDVTIHNDWVYKRPKSYLYGTSKNTPLTFTLTAAAIDAQSGLDRRAIEAWLLGHNTYKKLQIEQDDIANCYYNVIFTGASIKYVGNIMRGIVLSAECDAPWAWTFPKYLRYNFSGDQIKDFDFNFFNESDDNGYLYPITTFTLNSIGNSFKITNYSDGNRVFLLENLQPNEEITIDNCNKTITSSTGLYRLDAFNKNWLRLKKGNNLMHLTSGIGTFTMECSFPRAIGG